MCSVSKISFLKIRYWALLTVCLSILLNINASIAHAKVLHDAQHDFDFNIGTWHTHILRLIKPLLGAKNWTELNGAVTVKKIWSGRAQIEEIEADGKQGKFEGLTLFLYNKQSQQWSMSFANSDDGIMEQPLIGEFKNGRGEFYQQSMFNGKSVLVRMLWSDITANSHKVEQSFSADGGKTWEANFIGTLTRQTQQNNTTSINVDGINHDFDFELGSWKTSLKRLQHPLTGSTTWVDYSGTTSVVKVWNGKANIKELDVSGPAGHITAVSLSLYNTKGHQWSLNYSAIGDGVLSQPTVGEFRNGRGEFYDQENYKDRAIQIRFIITRETKDVCHFEQAFSTDGGKTWEVNWIATDTRTE